MALDASRWLHQFGWAAGSVLARFRDDDPAGLEDADAALPPAPADAPILLLGTPRSGTSWLGKIFDSHPDTLYRHEPDAMLEDDGLPWICPDGEAPDLLPAAAVYLRRMARTATLKTAGPGPSFAKSYRGAPGRMIRDGVMLGLRGLAAVGVDRRRLDRVLVPDLRAGRSGTVRVVVKSVSGHGRAGLLAAASGRTILILRDPWGQVASVLRGTAGGKFLSDYELGWIAATVQGSRHGLTVARLAAMPRVEQFAWHWAVCNERMTEELAGVRQARVIAYDALCAAPAAQARALFAFAGLAWHPQTEDFIARSTTHRGRASYYQVFRDTQAAVAGWRKDLSRPDQLRIAAILRQTSLARWWPDVPE